MKQLKKQYLLVLLITLFGILIFQLKKIPQDPSYHDFADKRVFLGISNASDVLSNLAILIPGFYGLMYLSRFRLSQTSKQEMVLWKLFFAANILVAVCSAYYHLAPDNARLAVDRFAISLVFMTFFSLMLIERVDQKLGWKIAPLLILAGLSSVIYWIYTEQKSAGDLRFYILIQFAPIILLVPILFLFPSKLPGKRYLFLALGFYAIAKVVEFSDQSLFTFTSDMVSGHTLKHYMSGLSVFMILKYLQKRKTHIKSKR